MILISHRGNINGKDISRENHPSYIDEAIQTGYDVEIDIWVKNNTPLLGHDVAQYGISYSWLEARQDKLWIHCKNFSAIEWLVSYPNLNYFWHQKDDLTITSKGILWAYPGKQPIKNSIAVLPEIFNDDLSQCIGICSDYIQNYNK